MFDDPIFYDGWASLLSILVSVPFVYVMVIVAVKLSGKRAMSQLNNFDWIVTVAMGAIAASAIVLGSVTVLDALVAIAALLALQVATTYATSRSERAEAWLKSPPALLVADGHFLKEALLAHRLSENDVRSVLREGGYASMSEVAWVVLEADARLSVIPKSAATQRPDTMGRMVANG